MIDSIKITPPYYIDIQAESNQIAFSMPSDLQTGSLLDILVSSKPGGEFLELGTGTGLALAWIVSAMQEDSRVISVDNNPTYIAIAKKYFDKDKRVSIHYEDASQWILNNQHRRFDLIFADAWPGKYEKLNETLSLLKKGGFYVIDDMLPQPNWPIEHPKNVQRLLKELAQRSDIKLIKMNWSTGIIIAIKIIPDEFDL
ncbi:MAG: class I SAM-dependent methyltransferase [Spirosomataceae bacterium]